MHGPQRRTYTMRREAGLAKDYRPLAPRDGGDDGRVHIETIGIITVGQRPRPDLERVFRQHLPEANLPIRSTVD